MQRLVIGFLVVLSACTQTLADDTISTCHPLCRCATSLPGDQRACVASCQVLFERAPLADACVACVVAHTNRCSTLIDDCNPVCAQDVPLESLGLQGSPESRIDR